MNYLPTGYLREIAAVIGCKMDVDCAKLESRMFSLMTKNRHAVIAARCGGKNVAIENIFRNLYLQDPNRFAGLGKHFGITMSPKRPLKLRDLVSSIKTPQKPIPFWANDWRRKK
jgi:hypothetical protein